MDNEIGTSVARNTTVMLGAQAVTWVSSFVLLLFLPRYLGSADYGRLYLAISTAMILSIVIDFGGTYLIPKEVSRRKEKTPRILASYLGLRAAVWVAAMAGLMLFCWLAGYSQTIFWLMAVLGISKLFEGAAKAIKSCFQGHELMEYPSLGMIAQKVFTAGAAVAALLLGADSLTIAIIMAVGVVLNLVVCAGYMPKIVASVPRLDMSVSLDLVRTSIPYFLWSMFSVIYYRVDAVMLSLFSGEQVVGWYGGAYRFFDVAMFLPNILTTVLFPIFSKLSLEGGGRFNDTFRRSLRFVILFGIPVSCLFFFYAHNIIDLFYGLGEYAPSATVLQIFAPGIMLVYIDFILGSSILATDKQRLWAGIGFAAILVNVGLNWVMIPWSGAAWGNGGIGAAVTTLATEAFILVSALLILPSRKFRGLSSALAGKALAGAGAMAATIWLLGVWNVPWIAQAVLSVAVYFTVAAATGMIRHSELQFIRKFIGSYELTSILKPKSEQL